MRIEHRDHEPNSGSSPKRTVNPKHLYIVDAVAPAADLLTSADRVTRGAREAATAGGANVLREDLVGFPDGAITLVLILAESHLSIHTWPAERKVAIDLFSCGTIDGERVIAELTSRFGLSDVNVRRVERGVTRPPG